MRKEITLTLMIVLCGCAHVPQSAVIVRIEDIDKPVKAVSQPPMEYTEIWQHSRVQAQATVSFAIREDGSVADVVLVQATNTEIGRAGVELVKKWRFDPPTCGGTRAKVQISTPGTAILADHQ